MAVKKLTVVRDQRLYGIELFVYLFFELLSFFVCGDIAYQ